jgi:hypothetical protein
MNTEEIDLLMKLVDKVGDKSESPKVNPDMRAKAERATKLINQQTERIKRLESDTEVIEEMVETFRTNQHSINRELKHAIANVPKIKPVDTFNNSDDYREMVKLLEDLKTTMYRHSDQLKTIEEWIKATGHVEKARLREEIASEDEDVDLREVALEDVIEPLVPHITEDWDSKLVHEEIVLDTRTHKLLRALNVVTFEELMCFTEKELMSNNNFGGCSMAKLNKDLQGLGLSLSKGE